MLNKYALTIGGVSVPRVVEFTCSKFARQETTSLTLAGTATVDRSTLKYRVTAKIAIISASEWSTLRTKIDGIAQSCTFYDDTNTSKTLNMIISLPELPKPDYLYGLRTEGVYYRNIILKLEEV